MINSYYINPYSLILIFFILFVSFSFSPIYSLENTTNTTLNNTLSNPLQIDITSHHTNMSIPIGNLTIYGISSDTLSSDCSVFASWGNEPFRIANPIGHGNDENYSTWSFTFDKSYHEIILGNNTINAKISCEDQSNQKHISVFIIGQSSEMNTINNIKNQTTFKNSTSIQNTNILNRTIDYDYILSTNTQIEFSDNSKMLNILEGKNITLNNINNTSLNNISNMIETKTLSVNMSFPDIIFIEDIFQLFVAIFDPETSQPIPEAHILGNIQKIGESFMKPLKFAGDTNNNGTYSFNWKVIDNYELGNYTMSIIVQASNYSEYSEVKNFIIQNTTTSKLLSDDTMLIDPANEETFEDIQQPSDSDLLSDDTMLIDPANEETFEDAIPSIEEEEIEEQNQIEPFEDAIPSIEEEEIEEQNQIEPFEDAIPSIEEEEIEEQNQIEPFEDAIPSIEEEEIEEQNQIEPFEDAIPSIEEEEIEEQNQIETFEDAIPSIEEEEIEEQNQIEPFEDAIPSIEEEEIEEQNQIEPFEDAIPSIEEEEIEEQNQIEPFEDAIPSIEEEEIEEQNQIEPFEDAIPSIEPPFKLPSLFP